MLFSDTIAYSTSKFFFYSKNRPRDSYHYETLEDLRAYKLGGIIGYFYEEIFSEAGLDVDYVTKEQQAIEKLKRGRIELLPLRRARRPAHHKEKLSR